MPCSSAQKRRRMSVLLLSRAVSQDDVSLELVEVLGDRGLDVDREADADAREAVRIRPGPGGGSVVEEDVRRGARRRRVQQVVGEARAARRTAGRGDDL